jgi:hypothetical protein
VLHTDLPSGDSRSSEAVYSFLPRPAAAIQNGIAAMICARLHGSESQEPNGTTS